jgi:RNA polymerase sigma-70 factor (ECF subfamily)
LPAEKAEFESLVALYEQRVFNVVYRMVGDYDEAADLTQEAFVRAYRAYENFRGDAQPYTWLYRIAVNLVRDHAAARKRRQAAELSLEGWQDDEAREFDIPDETYTPERALHTQELRLHLEKAIMALQEGYRECVVLREFEGLSYQQIADAMGITVEAVRSRLARARAMMRRRLASYLGLGIREENE